MGGGLEQARFGKADMPLVAQFLQDVANGGAGPQRRGPIDSQPLGQLLGGLEADAPNIRRESIGIGADELDSLVAIGFVDAHGSSGAHAMRLEKDHDRTYGLLLLPALTD